MNKRMGMLDEWEDIKDLFTTEELIVGNWCGDEDPTVIRESFINLWDYMLSVGEGSLCCYIGDTLWSELNYKYPEEMVTDEDIRKSQENHAKYIKSGEIK